MNFLSRTLPGIGELFSPLKQTIRAYLLPALSGKCAFSDAERQLISLPSCLGGLGITDSCVSSAFQFDASPRLTGPLVSLLLEQDLQFIIEILNEQLALKQEIHLENHRRSEELAASLHPLLSTELQHARELACLKGASSWLTVLPLDEHGFSLHKGDFRVTYPNAMVASFDLFLDQNGQKTGLKLLLHQYHFNSEESKCSFPLNFFHT